MDIRLVTVYATLLPCNRRVALAKSILSSGEVAERDLETADLDAAVRIQDECAKRSIEIVSCLDPEYPESLKQSPMPPPSLFVIGDSAIIGDSQALAVVGARNADMASSEIAADFAHAAAASGIRVVSGLALGVDGAAHLGALRSGMCGATIAVVASGLDTTYPAAHTELAAKIYSNGGAIISEYPPGTAVKSYHFLERNRIVAGLSFGVVVVQAGDRSGALVTARLALEAGREVWVVPGNIRDARFKGSNKLIQDGAHLISSPFEIPGVKSPDVSVDRPQFSDTENKVLEVVRKHGNLHLSEVGDLCELPIASARVLVGELERKGFLQVTPGNQVRISDQDQPSAD